jgi:hypothetical protein
MPTNFAGQNSQLQLAFDFVQYTNKNIFLTGKAGTGKTTFLHNLRRESPKRMIVVAPTGVAAINAGGVTIHSFFQLGFGPRIPGMPTQGGTEGTDDRNAAMHAISRFSHEKINIIRSLDLLVIDEISMVRADLLDGIDEVLRRFKYRNRPFGGVQLLMIGDLQQLAPVAKDDEWEILRSHYDTVFFFSSKALKETSYLSIELKHIYRQSDRQFIELLNKVRENQIDGEALADLNKRHIPGFNPDEKEGYITLTTHNAQAQDLNERKLKEVAGKAFTFKAKITDEFPEYSFPTDRELMVKINAQVMFVKNDPSPEKQFYNGKIGRISNIEDDLIYVQCPDMVDPILVEPLEWQNVKYSIDAETKEITEKVAGTFVQYPLKLAWAITIHKSQGLTFEKAIIDAKAAFAHGQVYVALSRCRNLEGLVLSTPILNRSIISNSSITVFNQGIEENSPTPEIFKKAQQDYEEMLIMEIFDFSALERKIQQAIRVREENKESLTGSVFDKLNISRNLVNTEIIDVAGKFAVQLRQFLSQPIPIEQNTLLQERIQKASIYFHEKLGLHVQQALNAISIETDNKTVRKAVSEQLDRIEKEIVLKLASLEACRSGFTVKEYLDARAKASVELPAVQRTRREQVRESKGAGEHPILYIKLRDWRELRAASENLQPRLLLSQKVLIRLTEVLPVSRKELADIKGFGQKKIKQYGREILDLIISYRAENKMEVPSPEFLKDEFIKKEKIDSKKESFVLFSSGKNIGEIASLRELAPTTIESHLAHYVGTGELKPEQFMEAEKLEKIMDYFSGNSSWLLTPAKDALGEDVSYGELRIVVKYLEFIKNRTNV